MAATIRPARAEDGPALREIERHAGERFRDVGLDAVADHDPMSRAELATYADAGRSWVVVDDRDRPVGYVLVDVVDGNAHIEQISVHPDHQGRGIGRALVDQVRRWARAEGRPAITLTTFTDVPWNGPLYEHLGFRILAEVEIGPELRALRDAEAEHGLDLAPRSCMRLVVGRMSKRGGVDEEQYRVHPIGRVQSSFVDRASAPRQGDEGAPDAWLVLDPSVADAMRDLEAGHEVIVLTWLDRARRDVLVVQPRDDPTRALEGVFTTRSPDRPNPIGLHRVEIVAIDGTRILVRNLEALDGTPIVDIKPVLGPVDER